MLPEPQLCFAALDQNTGIFPHHLNSKGKNKNKNKTRDKAGKMDNKLYIQINFAFGQFTMSQKKKKIDQGLAASSHCSYP